MKYNFPLKLEGWFVKILIASAYKMILEQQNVVEAAADFICSSNKCTKPGKTKSEKFEDYISSTSSRSSNQKDSSNSFDLSSAIWWTALALVLVAGTYIYAYKKGKKDQIKEQNKEHNATLTVSTFSSRQESRRTTTTFQSEPEPTTSDRTSISQTIERLADARLRQRFAAAISRENSQPSSNSVSRQAVESKTATARSSSVIGTGVTSSDENLGAAVPSVQAAESKTAIDTQTQFQSEAASSATSDSRESKGEASPTMRPSTPGSENEEESENHEEKDSDISFIHSLFSSIASGIIHEHPVVLNIGMNSIIARQSQLKHQLESAKTKLRAYESKGSRTENILNQAFKNGDHQSIIGALYGNFEILQQYKSKAPHMLKETCVPEPKNKVEIEQIIQNSFTKTEYALIDDQDKKDLNDTLLFINKNINNSKLGNALLSSRDGGSGLTKGDVAAITRDAIQRHLLESLGLTIPGLTASSSSAAARAV
jgi:hypothetical protein